MQFEMLKKEHNKLQADLHAQVIVNSRSVAGTYDVCCSMISALSFIFYCASVRPIHGAAPLQALRFQKMHTYVCAYMCPSVCIRGVVLTKEVGGHLKQDLDKDF